MLATIGVYEDQAREHSLEWIRETLLALNQIDRKHEATKMRLHFVGASAAYHGEDAFSQMEDVLDELERDPEQIAVEEDINRLQHMMPGAFQRIRVVDGGMA